MSKFALWKSRPTWRWRISPPLLSKPQQEASSWRTLAHPGPPGFAHREDRTHPHPETSTWTSKTVYQSSPRAPKPFLSSSLIYLTLSSLHISMRAGAYLFSLDQRLNIFMFCLGYKSLIEFFRKTFKKGREVPTMITADIFHYGVVVIVGVFCLLNVRNTKDGVFYILYSFLFF